MLASVVGLGHELWGRLPWLLDAWRGVVPQRVLLAAGVFLACLAALLVVPRRWRPLGMVSAWVAALVLAARSTWFLGLPDGFKAMLLLVWSLALGAVATLSKLPSMFGVLAAASPAALGLLSARGWAILGTVVLVSLAACGFGGLLVLTARKLARASGERPGERPGSPFSAWVLFLAALAVGVGCLSLLGLLVAEAGLASPWLLGAFLVSGIVLFFLVSDGPRNWLALALSASRKPLRTCTIWLLLPCVALVGLFFLATLGPETGADALGGRVALPAKVLAAGKIAQWPGMVEFTAGYAGGEFFYLWLFPWISDSCARAWAWWVMLLWLVTAWLSRKDWALFAWLAVFASTHAWWQVFSGFVDLHQAFLLSVGALALGNDERGGEAARGFLVAFIAASAVATKINALPALPALFVWGAWRALQLEEGQGHERWTRLFRFIGFWAVGCLLALGPWVLRAWYLTGNPTFPLFNQVWQSPQASLEPVRAPFGPRGGLRGWLAVPWTLFFRPSLFAEIGAFNPLLLLLPLALAFALPRDRRAVFLTAGFTLCVVAWAVTEPNSRYLWPAAGLLLVAGLVSSVDEKAPARTIVAPAAGLAVIAFLVQIVSEQFWPARESNGKALPVALVVGRETREDYLSRMVNTYGACMALGRRYGQQFRVWQVNARDFLYCPGEAFSTPFGDYRVRQEFSKLIAGKDLATGQTTRKLRELGFTHVMLYSESTTPWFWVARGKAGGVLSEAEEACCMVPEFAHRGLRVFRLKEGDESVGLWEVCPSFAFAGSRQDDQRSFVTYVGSFAGGELLRLRIGVGDGQGSDPTVDLAVRDKDQKLLLLFWRDTFGKRQAGQPIEILQTLPEVRSSVQLTVVSQRSRVQNVSCEVFRQRLGHAGAGGER